VSWSGFLPTNSFTLTTLGRLRGNYGA